MEGTKANTDIPLRMPTDQELSKLSDEHKALLAQKCVTLLARRRAVQQQQTVSNEYNVQHFILRVACWSRGMILA